jgi:hypothetical protein
MCEGLSELDYRVRLFLAYIKNHDPASSLFADKFQELKTKSSQSVVVQDNNFFDFS